MDKVSRELQLNDLAYKLKELERTYNVKLISSNGYHDAVVIDRMSGCSYNYINGKVFHADDCCL